VDKLAEKFAGRATIAKINVDQQKQKAQQFGVTGIPMIIVFKNGQNMEQLIGFQSEEKLTQVIEKYLSQ